MRMDKKETFKMTYSAQQQEKIQEIRKKYAAPEEDKMAQLQALDAGVSKKATAAAIVAGVVGTLIMGVGMSLTMSGLGKAFGSLAMPVGIAAGVVGIGILIFTYPLYNRVLKKEREKIAPEIFRLTDELMK